MGNPWTLNGNTTKFLWNPGNYGNYAHVFQVKPLGLKKPDKQQFGEPNYIMYPNVVHVFSGLS